MYIAKMTTKYPDFHGMGYYNFIMADDEDELMDKVERNSHDFSLEGIVKTRHQSIENILKAYPTKATLNDKYFKEG